MTTFVIAEAASCHDGSLLRAKRLIAVAHEAGADAVKFQFWSDADKLADRRHVEPRYRDIYKRYQMPPGWLRELSDEARHHDLKFLCTTFLPEDVWVVAPLVHALKVASFEALDRDLLARCVEARGSRQLLLVSTGMLAAVEIAELVGYLRGFCGLSADVLVLMHCTSSYPTPPDQANLACLYDSYSVNDGALVQAVTGFSDHTGLLDTGALAVAAGAQIVEVHMQLYETDRWNPDAASFALRPSQLADYIARIRRAGVLVGNVGTKRLAECERASAHYRVRS